MPVRAPSACRRPGCPGLVRDGVCSRCGPLRQASNWDRYHAERNQVSRHLRGYGRSWEKLRAIVLDGEIFCRQCMAHGRQTYATQVDHVIPKSWGGDDSLENLQPLCAECHGDKTRHEVRGKLRKATVTTTVVAGPPGSGKSTYVAERRQPGDLTWDTDAIFAAMSGLPVYDTRRTPLLPFVMEARRAVLLRLARTSGIGKAWIITTEGNALLIQQMADDLGAALVVLAVPAAECLARIAVDGQRRDSGVFWAEIVDRWWGEWRATGGEGK